MESDEESFCKENVPPRQVPKKHVHFESFESFPSSMGQNDQRFKFLDDAEWDRMRAPISPQYDALKPAVLNLPNSNPRLSDDLELSVLDSDADPFKYNVSNDIPYSVLPVKTPLRPIQSKTNISNYPKDAISSAAKSNKHFNVGNFFTLPNSSSKYSTDPILDETDDDDYICKKTVRKPKPKCCCSIERSQTANSTNRRKPKKDPRNPKAKSDNVGKNTNGLEEKRLAILNNVKKITQQDDSVSDGTDDEEDISEPTVTDLYKIIKQQSEQLLSLQQRVDQLLVSKKREPRNQKIQHSRIEIIENSIHSKAQNMEELHKISIGVMTSFEMVMHSKETPKADEGVQTSCHSSENQNQSSLEKKLKLLDDFGNNALSDIIKKRPNNFKTSTKNFAEEMKIDKNTEVSRMASESLIRKLERSRTPPISPQPSVHVDINEYSESEDECSKPGIGWTFYNNVMNHVDQIVHDSPPVDLKKNKALHIGETNISNRRVTFEERNAKVTFPKSKPSSETSLHMKKLADKYLRGRIDAASTPIDRLPKVGSPNEVRNEMSFSTLQYMQKHRLLGNDNARGEPLQRRPRASPRILDITAIKRQPKLV